MIIEDNQLVIGLERKAFFFALTKTSGNNFECEIDSIIKPNKLLADHTILTCNMLFINMETGKTSEPPKFVLNLKQRFRLETKIRLNKLK